jgi:insertion element IS1 protein InsB
MHKLSVFNIKKYFTDGWGSYPKMITPGRHFIGTAETQKIENRNLSLRTRIKRLARKTICFSKLEKLHDGVIEMFIKPMHTVLPQEQALSGWNSMPVA